MRVFRIHIRPSGGAGDTAASFAYCLREGVLGLGWQVELPACGSEPGWELYERLAKEKFGRKGLHSARFLYENVREDDLIWTRDTLGTYYLARVLSPWEYLDTPKGRDADITNVVRCRILLVPQADDVPGSIVASFRPARTIQSIRNPTAVAYSRVLWNQLAESDDYPTAAGEDHDLFSFLDSEATEDVVFVYLQTEGWLVVPNSRKADTMGYEFVAIDRETFERAVVQVKSGGTPLDRGDWAGFGEKVFLFQSGGVYRGPQTPNVVTLDPSEMEGFVRANRRIVPRAVERWLRYLDETEL